MNFILSIINPLGIGILTDICDKLEIPLALDLPGHGTALKSMLDLLGIESREYRVVAIVANAEQTERYISEQRRRMYIDAPGNGISIIIPVKSVGGGSTLSYLNSGAALKKGTPDFSSGYELIVIIANEGHTDTVMDAARAAGARGGTVVHAKGTAGKAAKFFNVSIATEKELVLIVAKTSEKAAIMSSVISLANTNDEVEAIVFSLPVSSVAGLRIEDSQESENTAE